MWSINLLNRIILVVLIPVIFCITGCQKKDEEEPKPSSAVHSAFEVDTIRLEGGDWGYPSPYAHYPRGPGGFKMCLLFDSLLERDDKGLTPWLAEDYEIRENGKQYVFTIRSGVQWHDGKPLTAEDVRFSFQYASKYPMTWSHIFNEIEHVETIEENKVLITVVNPNATMLYSLGRTRIIPQHIWKDVSTPKEFTDPEAVIGCGPYRLAGYSKEHGTYRFEAFDDYWGPAQRIKTIEYIPVSEPILSLEKGEIHLSRVTTDVLPRFRGDASYKTVKSPGFWGYRLLFDMDESSILKDKKLRQAISYTIDLSEPVIKIARGAAIPGNAGMLPPDHVLYNPAVKQYEQNLEKAELLLSEAGYNAFDDQGLRLNTNGERLSFQILCSGREVRMVEILKEQLAKAGISVDILSVDGKTRDARVRNQEYQIAVIGHGGWGADPDYLRTRFSSRMSGSHSPSVSGHAGYNNTVLNDLLEKQHVEMDKQKRRELIFKIQEILAEDVPDIPLYYTTAYSVYKPGDYDGWMFMFDHHNLEHSKLSYLEREKGK